MKKLLVVSAIAALGFSSMAFANGSMPTAPSVMSDDTGIYLGISGGYAIDNWKNIDDNIINVSKDKGGVARAFLGYDFNKYFAVEAGYTYLNFFRPEINVDGTGANDFKVNKQHVADLVGKIKAPLAEDFDLYAKLGADYFWTQMNALNPAYTSYTNNTINLVYGAGMDYSVTPNVVVNAEWMRLNGNPSANFVDSSKTFGDYKPNADLFLVGVRYKFDM